MSVIGSIQVFWPPSEKYSISLLEQLNKRNQTCNLHKCAKRQKTKYKNNLILKN